MKRRELLQTGGGLIASAALQTKFPWVSVHAFENSALTAKLARDPRRP